MRQFKTDPRYLERYCIQSLAIFGAVNVVLFGWFGPQLHFDPKPWMWALPLLGVVLCGLPSSILHNCAHRNWKPRWLNDAIGEFCGTLMLYGFKGFQVGHWFHHAHPDDPRMDPHPPRGQSFPRFVVAPVKATLDVVERGYLQAFGDTPENRASLRRQRVMFQAGVLFRVAFWWLLLGPELFVLAYLPVYAANIFVFAHINYATHIERPDGQSEIVDLTHNLYYRYVNLVSMGGYYHKSHHRRPKFKNPSRVPQTDKPYLTWTPPQPAREAS
jgi:stearoyl-CoA desaturase (delta-9 desaturase)